MADKPLVTSTVVRAMLVMLAAVVAYKAAMFAGLSPKKNLVDIDSFHVAGKLVWAGKAHEAYFFKHFLGHLGGKDFMPWAYPPPFNLVVAPLGLMSITPAYLTFTLVSFAAYLVVLKRLAGPSFPFALAAAFPAVLMTAACGQNGFITASLVGLAALWLMAGRARAGVPLGLMIIKPHLVIPLALETVLSMRWAVIAAALATVAGSCAVATLVLGPSIWPAFLNGVSEAKVFLSEGVYPLYRMVSVYAAVKSFGAPAALAMSAQAVVAIVMLTLVVIAHRAGGSPRQVLGVAVLVSPFISPYAYDYDLCLYAVALALLMPDLQRLLSAREQVALLVLSMVGTGAGLAQQQWVETWGDGELGVSDNLISFGALPMLLAVALIWAGLRRSWAASARADAWPAQA